MENEVAPADDADARRLAEIQCRCALVWQRQRKLDKAELSYRKALSLDPQCTSAHTELGNVLQAQRRLDEAIAVYKEGLELDPNVAELHHGLVSALMAQGGPPAAHEYYELERVDQRPIEIGPADVLCCVVVRNEELRLPHFLDHYRRQGVARFLMVDNGSNDGTLAYLLAQPDVYLWRSTRSFTRVNFGSALFEVLLYQYGAGHWCLTVDTDELLVYADCETRSLPQLCRELEAKGKRVLNAVLLDMYSDRPIRETQYEAGQRFVDVCPYFDRRFFHHRYESWSAYGNQLCYFGGMRERVFGEEGRYNISKVALLEYDRDCVLIGGQHWTNRPRSEIAAETGALLHFKYFDTFVEYVRRETARKEHYEQGMQYAEYARRLAADEDLTLYDEAHSVRYEDSRQLVRLGVIQADVPHTPPADQARVEFPPIASRPTDVTRPFWSVMITAYTRLDYLSRALHSVLVQAPGAERMQIEVVNDAADAETGRRLEELVRKLGGERVRFYRHPVHLGHPHVFNLCIDRARGEWVHILHDDDWVEPGFYAALESGIRHAPDAGMAFCRQVRVNEAGEQQWVSWLERETPGRIDDWLERIAVMCRLQFVSAAVKRRAYESVGGFCPEAGSSLDWEMWKRLAARFPVWYEPRPLASFFQGPRSETHRLVRSGEQIQHARQAIEISASYLPQDRAEELTRRAREHWAAYALEQAQWLWRLGDTPAALANIREGLKCSRTHALQRACAALLAEMARPKSEGETAGRGSS